MRVRTVVTIVLGALVAAGVYYWRASGAATGPAVVTAAVTRGSVVETVEATGTLQALTTVQVGTQVSGTIKALYADFNSRVRKGQVIAELDPALFETQVAQARASLARLEADAQRAAVDCEDAQTRLRRSRELFAGALIARADLDTAEIAARQADVSQVSAAAQIAQARASLRQAEVNLAHTVIASPIDGVVISRNVDVGQTVAASMQAPTLFVLARDLTRMQVNASVAESDIGRIQSGQPVTFQVDAYPGRPFRGVVTQVRLEPIVEQNVVSYITTIEVANPDLLLKPGMTANVTIETARADDVLRIPNAALRVQLSEDVLARLGVVPGERPGGPSLWLLSDGQLRRVAVRTGVSDSRWTALVEGDVPDGATVVTAVATGVNTTVSTQSPLLPQRGRGAGAARGGAPAR